MQRREFLHTGAALAASGLLAGCAGMGMSGSAKGPKVVVVGGGYAGATVAKYIRLWSDSSIQVTVVEPNPQFISCPMSNLVIGGVKQIGDVSIAYDTLVKRYGLNWVRDRVTGIDPDKRMVKLAGGGDLPYDRLVVAPGVDMMWESLPSMQQPGAQDKVLHAWKAGAQTTSLRKQIEAMSDGGVFAIAIPLAPYRCPPGPYERACLVADYFKRTKPRSKVLILDANDDVTSKGALFKKAWADRYQSMIEYRPKFALADVDVAGMTLKFDVNDDVKADVLNVLPPMRAGEVVVQAGLATANRRWCEVDFLTFESKAAKFIHVLGDAIQVAPLMPKSAHMANQHAKVCAAAVVALLTDRPVNQLPLYNNTCYSYVSSEDAIRVSSVHRYDVEKKTMLTVPGSGGVSAGASQLEGRIAQGWARNIWADSLS